MGLKWLACLNQAPTLIGTWVGEDQRANIIKVHVSKRLTYAFKY